MLPRGFFFLHPATPGKDEGRGTRRTWRTPGPGLTGHGGVEGEGLEAGELFAPGVLHAVGEDVLPGIELQQLDALQDLRGLLQPISGVFLGGGAGGRERERGGSDSEFHDFQTQKRKVLRSPTSSSACRPAWWR